MAKRLAILLSWVAACGGSGAGAPVCPTSALAPGATEVVAQGLPGTEGLTFSPDGRLFVSAGDQILEVKPDGSTSKVADVPKAVGTAWWNGALYVASGDDGTNAAGGLREAQGRGAIYRVVPGQAPTLFATGILAPNFVAVAPWGELLVSDDCPSNTVIYAVSAQGVVRTWLDGIASANGLAFDAAG